MMLARLDGGKAARVKHRTLADHPENHLRSHTVPKDYHNFNSLYLNFVFYGVFI